MLSGLADKYGWPQGDEGAGDHARAAATFLTGVHVKKTEGADIQGGVSMDQIAAQGARAARRSSRRSSSPSSRSNSSARATPATAARMPTRSPGAVRRRRCRWRTTRARCSSACSAAATAPIRRRARRASQKEQEHSRFGRRHESPGCSGGLGTATSVRSTEYLEAVRDVERRIQKAEEQSERELPVVDQPAGIPGTFEEHAKLMFDLLLLAFQTDLTRVTTFMLGRESERPGLPGDRRARFAPSDVASSERSGEAAEAGEDQHVPHASSSPISWSGCGTRPTATARCSITRCCSTARASATATFTCTTICRWCSSAAAAADQGRTPCPLSEGHAGHEPLHHHARHAGRARSLGDSTGRLEYLTDI